MSRPSSPPSPSGSTRPRSPELRVLVLSLALLAGGPACVGQEQIEGAARPTPRATAPGPAPATLDVAMLQLVADPTNPLELSEAEKKAVQHRLHWIADAKDRVGFRKLAIRDAAPGLWRKTRKPAVSKERDAEKAFLKDAALAERRLREKALGALGPPRSLPADLPPPGVPPRPIPSQEESARADLTSGIDLQMLGILLTEMAEAATPEQARRLVPEVASLQAYVRDYDEHYAELRRILGPVRARAIQERASALSPREVDLSVAEAEAIDWADRGDPAWERPGE